jgi:nitrate reductase NapAB chaperone NapD
MTPVHIASLIVRAHTQVAHDVAARIALAPAAEIHAVENGKIVVVVESAGEHALADFMDEIRKDPDVLMVSLVYHQIDREETELS